MTGVFAAPVIHKSIDRVVGFIMPGERVKLRDVLTIGAGMWRVTYVHERFRLACRKCGGARLELLVVWAAPTTLTQRDDAILGVASQLLSPSAQANRIHDLGISDIVFHQRLNYLLDSREALERHPVVARLRRVRATRQRLRGIGEEG